MIGGKNIIEEIVKGVLKRLEEEKYYQDGKLYPMPNVDIAAHIEGAIKSESDAIEIYFNVLKYVKDKEDVKVIQEIIADEENHRKILMQMNKKYHKIPPAKD
jgi:rubrerythrin